MTSDSRVHPHNNVEANKSFHVPQIDLSRIGNGAFSGAPGSDNSTGRRDTIRDDGEDFMPHQIHINDDIITEARKYSEKLDDLNSLGAMGDMELLSDKDKKKEMRKRAGVWRKTVEFGKAVSSCDTSKITSAGNDLMAVLAARMIYGPLGIDWQEKKEEILKNVMFTFDEQLYEAQSKFHACKKFLHYWVSKDSVRLLKARLNKMANPRLEVARPDPCGITPIHLAFLHGYHEVGKFLVTAYPELALVPVQDVGCGFELHHVDDVKKTFKNKGQHKPRMADYAVHFDQSPQELKSYGEIHRSESGSLQGFRSCRNLPQGKESTSDIYHDDNIFAIMPFTGQNILHMCIVNRDVDLVRWLLEFFKEHSDALPGAIIKLLTDRATGRFFRLDGDFYFGETAIFFAACANHLDIFDLIVDYSVATTDDDVTSYIRNIRCSIDTRDSSKKRQIYLRDSLERSAWFTQQDVDEISMADWGKHEHLSEIEEGTLEWRRCHKMEIKFHHLYKEWRSMFGHDSITTRNRNGHSLLHMCVKHDLPAMYGHVSARASQIFMHAIEQQEVSVSEMPDKGRRKLDIHDDGEKITYIAMRTHEPFRGWTYANVRMERLRRVLYKRIMQTKSSLPKIENPSVVRARRLFETDHVDDVMKGSVANGAYLPAKPSIESRQHEVVMGPIGDIAASQKSFIRGDLYAGENFDSDDLRYYMNSYDYIIVDTGLPTWISDTANALLDGRLHKALSEDRHTPMTLAAARKSVAMLEYIIEQRKMPRMIYGPVDRSLIDLDGLEIPFHFHNFTNRNFPHDKRQSQEGLRASGFNSAIEWLCRTDQDDDDGREDQVGELTKIKAIQKVVNAKWTRTYKPTFDNNRLWALILCSAATLLLIHTDPLPKKLGRSLREIVEMNGGVPLIMYITCDFILLRNMLRELPVLITMGWRWFVPTRACRGVVIGGRWLLSSLFMLFFALTISRLIVSANPEWYRSLGDEETQSFVNSSKVLMAVSVVMTWLYMGFFYLGDEATGPFVLVVFKVVTRDLPNFLLYYSVMLAAFACALSLLERDHFLCEGTTPSEGEAWELCDISEHYDKSWEHLGIAALTLIRGSLAGDIGEGSDDKNPVLKGIFDTLNVIYAALVVLMLMNLFIAMISYTYDEYQEKSGALLLLEKYNFMSAEENLVNIYDSFVQWSERHFGSNSRMFAICRWVLECMYGKRLMSKATFIQYTRDLYAIQSKGKTLFEMRSEIEDWWEGSRMIEEGDDGDGSESNKSLTLLIVDPQVDFHEGGALAVQGANKDAERICKLIRRDNYQCFHNIIVTLDSHFVNDIGHKHFWKNEQGDHPDDWTDITYEAVKSGKWMPRNEKLRKWCEYYTRELEGTSMYGDPTFKNRKKTHFSAKVWPTHCLIGSKGFCVQPDIQNELNIWSEKTGRCVEYVYKGSCRITEMYSALQAEVPIPNKREEILEAFGVKDIAPFNTTKDRDELFAVLLEHGYIHKSDSPESTRFNTDLMHRLQLSRQVVVVGEAMSHCVNFTMRDIARNWIGDRSRLILLRDCSSSVTGFEDQGDEFVDDMADFGVTVITSNVFLYNGGGPYIEEIVPSVWSATGSSGSHLCMIKGSNFRLGATKVLIGTRVAELVGIAEDTLSFILPPRSSQTNCSGVVKVRVACDQAKSNSVFFDYDN